MKVSFRPDEKGLNGRDRTTHYPANLFIRKVVVSLQNHGHSLIVGQALKGIRDLSTTFLFKKKIFSRGRTIGESLLNSVLTMLISTVE